MANTIRKIIGEAYRFIGLAPNGILHDGQVGEGVAFANEVIKKYNESCLFPFTFVTLEGRISGGSVAIKNEDDGEGGLVGDIPANMSAVYWKRNETDMLDLEKCEFASIFRMRNSSSSPAWYSLVVESDEKAVLHFDALGSFNVLLVYPKSLPELKIDDVFAAPAIYEQVVKYGVAVRAATKASFEESVIADYQKLLDDAVNAIVGSNASKRPMTRKRGGYYNHHDEFNCPRRYF